MTLFVVVQKRRNNGQEYIATESSAEGYVEFSAARTDADAIQEEHGSDWEVYVGKVVPVEVPE